MTTRVEIDVPITLDIIDPRLLTQIDPHVVRVVHERDHFTCRCCGFWCNNYQQILIPGANWRDIKSLTTACIFCQQCFSLDSVTRMRSGVLISLPEVSQRELNRLTWEIYVARLSSRTSRLAKSSLDLLMNRRQTARELLGTDDPKLLAQQMRDARTESQQGALGRRLRDVRLFSLDRRILEESGIEFNQWHQILGFVRSPAGPYAPERRTSLPLLEEFCATYLT
jgi:intracellular multiplication protein IcmJ